jgi:hypothetical protein
LNGKFYQVLFQTSISIFQHSFAWKHVYSKKSPQKDRRNSRKSAPTHPFVSGRIACRRIKGRLRIVTMHLTEDEHHLTWKLQKLPHLSLKADDRGARCPGQGDQERLVAFIDMDRNYIYIDPTVDRK